MKLNLVQTVIAIALCLLIAYGLFCFHNSENKMLLSLGSFIFLAITLVISIGVSFDHSRTTTNVRVVSGIFFGIALVSNLIFALTVFSTSTYIVINGILMLVYCLIVYSINKAKQ